MPAQKDLKRLVRARMQKTGESYTTARSHLIRKKSRNAARPSVGAVPVAASPDEYARLAGMSNQVVKAKTGCDWTRWVWALDRLGARDMAHREIARLVHDKYKIPGWWSQTVTVGYERIRGLREIGQRRSGEYEAGKTRTLPVPVRTAFRAFKDDRTRSRWLPEPVTVRTAKADKTMRLGWEDGTIVAVYFTGKGRGKSQVAIQHLKLPGKARATEIKSLWGERLAALAEVVTS
jgi:hypothetical protein